MKETIFFSFFGKSEIQMEATSLQGAKYRRSHYSNVL